MSISPQIIQLVSHARESVEELAATYHNGGTWGDDLTGYCGIASRFLIALARRNNIYGMRLVCGTFGHIADDTHDGTHCWVEYDGFCIDLTISQFGFPKKKYKICLITDKFYLANYFPEMAGTHAVKFQKQWELGQNYESCSSLLWRIHKANYVKEYNGLVLR